MDKNILVGKSDRPVYLLGSLANRHGLVAGATGTGKTVSLMVLAEGFSRMGTPVFVADVKGDMSALSQKGEHNEKVIKRADKIGLDDFKFEANPVEFWDLDGLSGLKVSASIDDIGASLMGRMLELNDTQQGVLEIAFYYARDNDIDLYTLDDLRKLISTLDENREDVSRKYGLASTSSVGAIQRNLLRMDSDGVGKFFKKDTLDLKDFMRCTNDGRGYINILSAESLVLKPKIYSTFLLWMLTKLFQELPEKGDVTHPEMVFFFDEAHLLFDDCSGALLQRIEQVVRLIRSKGVGVYFCSQNPDDIPESVLGQLGNRVQHALRAFTPRDQKAVRAAAETFADNPDLDVRDVIKNLGVGEALVSMLNEKGTPEPVERALIAPPRCRMGTIEFSERDKIIESSELVMVYGNDIHKDLSMIAQGKTPRVSYDEDEEEDATETEPESESVYESEAEEPVDNRDTKEYTWMDMFKRALNLNN